MSVPESSEATVFMENLPVLCRMSPSLGCACPTAPPHVDVFRNGTERKLGDGASVLMTTRDSSTTSGH